MTLANAYARFLRRVLSWARFAGVPGADTDDIAQEVFGVFARSGQSVPDRAVPAWLRTTTRQIARRHLARLARRVTREQPDAADLASPQPSQEADVGAHEVERLLLDMVGRLPPGQQEVFLRHAAGEPIAQIAASLGWPVATAHKRYQVARETLLDWVHRTRAAEKRTTRGSTSFALMPLFASRCISRRPLVKLAGVALGAAGLLWVIVLCLESQTLSPEPVESPAHGAQPIFDPIVSFVQAPHERAALPASARSRAAPRTQATTTSPGELPELELVALARHALLEGSPARARTFLRRADQAYPHGTLLPERAALAVRARSR